MKKLLFTASGLILFMMIMVAADFPALPLLESPSTWQRHCAGYTIIEYDKGINCHGDTIKLTRRNGFAQRSPDELK